MVCVTHYYRPSGGAGYKYPRRQVVDVNKNKIVKPPKPKLVKTANTMFLLYHFPNLGLYVKVKPTTFPNSDSQPLYSELCALSLKTVEAIENSPHHEVIA